MRVHMHGTDPPEGVDREVVEGPAEVPGVCSVAAARCLRGVVRVATPGHVGRVDTQDGSERAPTRSPPVVPALEVAPDCVAVVVPDEVLAVEGRVA